LFIVSSDVSGSAEQGCASSAVRGFNLLFPIARCGRTQSTNCTGNRSPDYRSVIATKFFWCVKLFLKPRQVFRQTKRERALTSWD
jgi:hypothetical protein